MTFRLHVDAPVWRAHLTSERDRIAAAGATLAPVIKGNGYGFGRDLLVREVVRLGLDVIAVGTVWEAREVLRTHEHGFVGDVVVLTPWDPRDSAAMAVWREIEQYDNSHRIVRTISSPEALAQVGHRRHLLESMSPMRRFGLASLPSAPGSAEGVSVHLPLVHQELPRVPDGYDSVWVSHLGPEQLGLLRTDNGRVFARVGTSLWLGDRTAFRARGTVLEVHEGVEGPVGYRQRSGPKDSTLVVVGGGTAHGVALEAPRAAVSARQRAVSVASGVLQATGRALSPFHYDGRQMWFVEPPHMQVSMLWIPRGVTPPRVGDELPCDVRMTTAQFDEVVGL